MDYFQELEDRLESRIGSIPPEKIVFVGVGNRFRGDDAVGPLVIDKLSGRVPHAIDAGPSPENVTGAIKKLKPEKIVFIDALVFKDLPPGTPQIVEIDDIAHMGQTSHVLSLDVVMEYLKLETGADVFMIGVQPGYIADREGLSPGIGESLEKLAFAVLKAIKL
jgi:hydrogenase 3 maturation protease